MQVKIQVNKPQGRFLQMNNRFRALVGGYGSSKTYTGCISSCLNYYRHPNINQGYFAPTYQQIRDIFFNSIEEVADMCGLQVDIKEGNKEVHFSSGGQHVGTTICRSMDNPSRIIGFKIGHAFIDELDVLPTHKARESWRKIIARMRYQNAPNSIDVATTPEGFKFTYEMFKKLPSEKPELRGRYGIVHASTYENAANLPDDYIPALYEAYPENLREAYINGQFVNLVSGTVYRYYDRLKNESKEVIRPNDVLHIGVDFNVMKMAAVIFVQRSNGFHAVAELKDVYDTPDLITIIKQRWQDNGHRVIIYPDATGKNREAVDASKSDISLLQQARFVIRVKGSNPAIKDRVMSVNKAFDDNRVWVNQTECRELANCLEQQSYDKNGEPDKVSGHDHMNDAFGYFVYYTFPVIKPTITVPVRNF